ncbi:DUF885 domain-containing protein [Altererythrobacter lutimaris]|uniref:DUF885 domain-containing protein n=1 Tax=Altererythrobacter lutimaris TaxID=2743979 RepID=A0A850HC79_9SPHN|nr:DUF885 domain-containing protein [Altererythrobacter lutimaris]NVE94631.1 DUF885 domain-containing protein [Altererythrobacter lutimaris]
MSDLYKSITRRQSLKAIGAGVGGVSMFALLPGCSDLLGNSAGSAGADELLGRIAWNLLELNPASATSTGVDTGDKAYLRGELGGSSPEAIATLTATLREDRDAARSLSHDGLSADQITSLEVVDSAYTTALEGLALPYGDVAVGGWRNTPYVVAQNVGAYIDFPRFFDATQPVKTEEDVEAYLSRLGQVETVLDGELERMKEARAKGLVLPDFLLDATIAQMESALTNALESDTYSAPLARGIVENLGEEALDERADEAARISQDSIAPALARQLEELKSQRADAKSDPGIWAQPQGEEWYNWVLKATTTTSLSPDEIHEIGLTELDELHAQMDPILQEIGYTQGSVGERMQALGKDPRYQFAEGDPGREEIMDFIWEQINWVKGEMPRAFNTLVDPPLEVRRIPPAEEPGAPGAYGGAPSKDGSIPGRFWINLRTTDLHRRYDIPDLTFHEAIPGHVWEGEYSNRLPLIRTLLGFGSFSEGWALYAQQLADELGAYDDFKVGRLGYLQSLAFRACRLVVDTGLHHKRWSREQARQFFVERNGSNIEDVRGEVDRYCSWVGQACSYKIGHSEIVRQRGRAETELAEAYDFKAFNDAVILGGNVPLDVLAKNVDRYIAGAQA